MADFVPVNTLEIALRNVITDKNTPLWSFYTPLAAAELWVIARKHPELDGSDLIAPEGENPGILTFTWKKKDEESGEEEDDQWIGIYTASERAERAMARWDIPQADWHIISARGYELLRLLSQIDANLCVNLGCEECQETLDPDMIEILLARPEPQYAAAPPDRTVDFEPQRDPKPLLGPLKDFLAKQPNVRGAWIMASTPAAGSSAAERYEIELLMIDPEDKSLLEKVCTIAKAVTPIDMEWTSGVLMGDDRSFRLLAQKHPPFYKASTFPEKN